MRLMQPLMNEGILINRTENELLGRQSDFVVYSIDGAGKATVDAQKGATAERSSQTG
jgi:hypothetical protein